MRELKDLKPDLQKIYHELFERLTEPDGLLSEGACLNWYEYDGDARGDVAETTDERMADGAFVKIRCVENSHGMLSITDMDDPLGEIESLPLPENAKEQMLHACNLFLDEQEERRLEALREFARKCRRTVPDGVESAEGWAWDNLTKDEFDELSEEFRDVEESVRDEWWNQIAVNLRLRFEEAPGEDGKAVFRATLNDDCPNFPYVPASVLDAGGTMVASMQADVYVSEPLPMDDAIAEKIIEGFVVPFTTKRQPEAGEAPHA